MEILDQRLVNDDLTPFRFQASPNIGQGKLNPKFLIIHYTEGASLDGSVIWLTNKESGLSCHLAIGRDGTIVQMVPFDRIAWHAGVSAWAGLTNLNRYSIGIELDNAGMLKKTSEGWLSSFGRIYPDDQVIEAVHQFGTQMYGWQTYTPEQLQACQAVAVELVRQYGLQAILGHDEIAPRRKWDPGPAFPMDDFRNEVMALAKNLPPPDHIGPISVTEPPAEPPAATVPPPEPTPPKEFPISPPPPATVPPAEPPTPP